MADALRCWYDTASRSRTELAHPNSDWTLYIGPDARTRLEHAVHVLPRRKAAALRAVVERADEAFLAKTLENPLADSSAAWWTRRWAP